MLIAGITSKEDLVRFISQEALIETNPSINGLSKISEVRGLYFGLGLCNGTPMLSTGLPVDVLSMILSGEQLDVPKHILIGNTHAIANGFDAQTVDQLSGQYLETIQKTIENLGFSKWKIIRASEIDQAHIYKDILRTVKAPHDYIRRELTDMCWFSREEDVNLKIGWILNGRRNSDELSFDREFQSQFGDKLGFIYVVSGRTFNPNRLRSAPYLCIFPEERIMLQADENVASKIETNQEQFGPPATRPYEKFLSQIVRLYDGTVERTERGPLTNRLQQVIDRCTK